ncbi:phosphatase PAP2 family protein [Rhodococcus spongiicola]|uniref:Phosphatase PAP2 family protein n=1 Tax=Rhodococcus spongiicola TaxID=2487352 RepID=A0A3S3AR31_9NOCA|nr:phosphatase PAP2 family protein [Rhodococcus spongiicola]RVW06424.1 phosphatase PAP2 family protein [Rhodococcus spongiicola]
MTVDQSVLQWMLEHRAPLLTDIMTVVTHSGGTVAVFAVVAVVTILLLRRQHRAEAVMVSGAMLTGWALMSSLKLLFGRMRPPASARLVELDTYSFPSGHAMMTAILACVLGAVVVRFVTPGVRRISLLVLLACYTLAVGASRVYLGAHWLTDVLAGWAFGVVWAGLWIWAVRRRRAPVTRSNGV